ncbi:Lysosomal alpha-mannosidase [Nymphon striatum]|nr:Lysosomal alpha-mannosidase [Nymphon striatum]
MSGNNTRSNLRASGAYIFRPNGTHPYILTTKINAKMVKGPLVNEIHQIFSPWISQIIRLYKDESHCEFEWLAGPIPIKDGIGKEIISRYDTKIKSGDEFFTDSNGREILKRVLLHDDGFGVGEPLNETAYGVGLVTRGTHYLLVSKVDNAQVLQRKLAEKLFMSPWTSFSSAKLDSDNARLQFSALTKPLPPNVHLLTLEQWTAKTVLIRLEHFFEKTDDPKGLSQPAKDLFSTFEITKATEMWLDGVYPLSEVKRLKWKTTPATSNDEGPTQDPVNLENIILNPMQIRTFVLEISKRIIVQGHGTAFEGIFGSLSLKKLETNKYPFGSSTFSKKCSNRIRIVPAVHFSNVNKWTFEDSSGEEALVIWCRTEYIYVLSSYISDVLAVTA